MYQRDSRTLAAPRTTDPSCLTSGENKTSVGILAICLWVMNHEFMNHKRATESRGDLCGGDFVVGACEAQMCLTGFSAEWLFLPL